MYDTINHSIITFSFIVIDSLSESFMTFYVKCWTAIFKGSALSSHWHSVRKEDQYHWHLYTHRKYEKTNGSVAQCSSGSSVEPFQICLCEIGWQIIGYHDSPHWEWLLQFGDVRRRSKELAGWASWLRDSIRAKKDKSKNGGEKKTRKGFRFLELHSRQATSANSNFIEWSE